MPFAYLKDSLFLSCFAIYWIHRVLSQFGLTTQILRGYLNDLICAPFWVPIAVWITMKLGLRRSNDIPHTAEIVIPLLAWSVLFEVVLPRWGVPTVADPFDVLAYWLGAMLSAIFWRWHYRPRTEKVGCLDQEAIPQG